MSSLTNQNYNSNCDEINNCRFCQILQTDEHDQIIKRGKNVTAIHKDYASKTVNFLLISNEHIKSGRDLNLSNFEEAKIWCEFLTAANHLSRGRDFGLKTVCGKNAGQTVEHLHVHVFSYDKAWFPNTSAFKDVK